MDTTVVKGVSVLELLARAKGPVRLTAIAEKLGLPKSNVHRLLQTLSSLGYVSQEAETGRYYATLKLWELGSHLHAANPIRQAAAAFLQDIYRATRETVSLSILDGDDMVYLDKIISPRPLPFTTRPGSRVPAALNSSGRAMLAYEPKAEAIVRRTLKAVPKAKVLTVEKVMKEIDQVRIRGFAGSASIFTAGVVGVAAPVVGRDGRAVAALSVSGTNDRFDATAREKAAKVLMEAAAHIAETFARL